jgi:flagellar hook-associated protein 1 FlgK
LSLSIALNSAASGLAAAQASLTAVSDNIANVNTPGYVRKVVTQEQLVVNGAGQGVSITGVHRVTDQYLQLASLTASSDASRYGITSQFLDSAQSLFGDPSGPGFFFNLPDEISASFAASANDPSSSLLRGQALNSASNFLSDADRINTQISQLSSTVDSRITDDVSHVNDLLTQINRQNTDISRARLSGGDSTGSENAQDQLLNDLSGLMNVKVSPRDGGGVTVRSAEGVLLAGDGASTLTYNHSSTTNGYISVVTPGASAGPQSIAVNSGEIRGLLDLRNSKLPGLADQLGEFISRTAQQLNAASNASTAFPPPTSLTGRNTGLDATTASANFTGTSTVAVLNASGAVQKTVAINFTAGTMSINAGPGIAFTPANFVAQLNANLGASGTASFANGALTVAATGGNGISIDPGTATKAGQGFSQFFGLNDLIRSSGVSTFDTGLAAGDANGFTPGATIALQLSRADGTPIQSVTVAVPAAGLPTMGDLVNSLNSNASGVGLYGAFTLDAQGGLTFKGNPPLNAQLSVIADTTQRGAGGPSLSALFGIGTAARVARPSSYLVNPTLAANPTRLPFARLNLGVSAGTPAISAGDGQGAQALADAGAGTTLFKAAGSLGNITTTLADYGAQFGGAIGRDAATADSQKTSSTAVKTEADTRRQAVEGVNIDEELIHLTTYQQAYNANARMITAAKQLFDILANLIQ